MSILEILRHWMRWFAKKMSSQTGKRTYQTCHPCCAPCGSGGDDVEGFVCDERTSVIDFSTDDRHGLPLCGAMHKCIFMEFLAVATDNSIFMVGFGSGIKMIEN